MQLVSFHGFAFLSELQKLLSNLRNVSEDLYNEIHSLSTEINNDDFKSITCHTGPRRNRVY